MRKLFYLATVAAFALVPLSAESADMAIQKALKPKQQVLLTYQGCGTYLGLGTFGEVDRANVTGVQGEALNANIAGAAINLQLGYMCGNGPTWWAVDASAEWFNIGGSNVSSTGIIPASIHTDWGFSQRVLWGGPLSSVLNLLPNLGTVFPTLPAPPVAVVGTVHPYIFAAVHERDVSASYLASSGKIWRVNAGLGVGAKQQLGPVQGNPTASQVTLDWGLEYLIPGSGVTLGNVNGITGTANTGGGARAFMTLEY